MPGSTCFYVVFELYKCIDYPTVLLVHVGKRWKRREREEDIIMNVEGRQEQVTSGWMSRSPSVMNVAMETAQSSGHGKHR